MTYNLLPKSTRRKYGIIYSELVHDNITIFKNSSEKWGVIIEREKPFFFSRHKILIPAIYNSIGFIKSLELIMADMYEDNKWDSSKNITSFFKLDGALKWQSQKGTTVHIDAHGNIIMIKAAKYGLLDKDFAEIVSPAYDSLMGLNNKYFIAKKDEQFGIIDRSNNIVLEFNYTQIFWVVQNLKLVVQDNKDIYFVFDLGKRELQKLPFVKLLYPSSNTYSAPSAESNNQYKSIIGGEQVTYSEYEMTDYKGKWGIIWADGRIKIPNDYDYIDFLRNPFYYKVCKGDIEINPDAEGYQLIAGKAKWGIIDANNKIIVPIEYDWIDEVEDAIWVVYKGGAVFYNDDYQEDYWMIKGAKLGVYNKDKLIVPIMYDTIQKNWFRVKDYIFVQDENKQAKNASTDFDVYTFNGEKIEKNKPSPKDHIYYGN